MIRVRYWTKNIHATNYNGWVHIVEPAYAHSYGLELSKHNDDIANYHNFIDYEPLPHWWVIV